MGVTSLGFAGRGRVMTEAFAGVAELIRGIPVAMVTSVDQTGIVRTCQLPNINTSLADDLWFLASSDAPLVTDVRSRPDVIVTFADRSGGRFIVVNGTVHLRNDRDRVRQLWHPVLASWLPDGPDDPEIAPIQLQIQQIDLWEYGADAATAPVADRE